MSKAGLALTKSMKPAVNQCTKECFRAIKLSYLSQTTNQLIFPNSFFKELPLCLLDMFSALKVQINIVLRQYIHGSEALTLKMKVLQQSTYTSGKSGGQFFNPQSFFLYLPGSFLLNGERNLGVVSKS